MSQARFQKQQREKARRERAAAKWAKRVERANTTPPEPEPQPDQATVLAELAALHESFHAGLITFDDFEAAKHQLTAQLDVH
jgi:hypothetical protein